MFVVEVQYFDGTPECAEVLREWGMGKLGSAVTDKNEVIILIETLNSDNCVIKAGNYIGKDAEGYLVAINKTVFEHDYIKI